MAWIGKGLSHSAVRCRHRSNNRALQAALGTRWTRCRLCLPSVFPKHSLVKWRRARPGCALRIKRLAQPVHHLLREGWQGCAFLWEGGCPWGLCRKVIPGLHVTLLSARKPPAASGAPYLKEPLWKCTGRQRRKGRGNACTSGEAVRGCEGSQWWPRRSGHLGSVRRRAARGHVEEAEKKSCLFAI